MLQLFDCDFLSVGNLLNEFGANQLRSVEISNQVRNNWQLFDNSIASRKWIQLKSYPQLSAVYPHTCSQSSLQISSLDLVSQNNLAGGKGGHCSLSQKVSNEFSLFLSHLTLEASSSALAKSRLVWHESIYHGEKKKKCRFRLDFKTGYFRLTCHQKFQFRESTLKSFFPSSNSPKI